MFNVRTEEIEWGGRRLKLETGRIARQADGAVMATYGETCVLATAVAEKSPKVGIDFFPLTVNYQEKTYAAGKIPGGFFKREGRPSEKETLVSRLIDRPIRPLFAQGFRCETQVIATVLSHDMENDPDIVAMIAAFAALTLSDIPFPGPLGAARVGYENGNYVLNPTLDEMEDPALDLIVAGTAQAVLMVESQARELPEDVMLGAVMFGQNSFQPVLDAIARLAEQAAATPRDIEPSADESKSITQMLREKATSELMAAYRIADKRERRDTIGTIRQRSLDDPDFGPDADQAAISGAFKTIEKEIVRGNILETGKRIDGRSLEEIRGISCQTSIVPRVHGTALFTRGETQAMVFTTLGTGEDEQFVDALDGTYKESFLLHYNFPPYSVGETGRVGFTGRREVGHGKLAWRAIRPVLPPKDQFPYTIRVVSEITESNGSSSMATVCGASLSLMDAGVPLARPVAGIAMGLIKEGDRFVILSDILGDEDHLGDMDFKVAGTRTGITSLQMDIKITGISEEIMRTALDQALEGRMYILGEMAKALDEARPELGEHAPRIEAITIPVDKIRDVIGTGGKVIREIVEKTGAKIDIGEDGTVKIASADSASILAATKWIRSITAEPEVGEIYDGKVVKVVDFGAFVNFFGSRDGLVHISELSRNRPRTVGEVVKEGDTVKVKLLSFDSRGKVRLSMKAVNQNTGEDISPVRTATG